MKFDKIVLLCFLAVACEKGKFAAETASSEAFEVRVIDNAPATSVEPKDDLDAGEPSDTRVDKTRDVDTDTDAKDCAAATGVSAERVKVSGSDKNIALGPQDAFALKVTGNTNTVSLKLASAPATRRLAAVCLFLAGNQNQVNLDIGMVIGQIFIKARGNQAQVVGLVSKEGVIEQIRVDASGHQPSITWKGEGAWPKE